MNSDEERFVRAHLAFIKYSAPNYHCRRHEILLNTTWPFFSIQDYHEGEVWVKAWAHLVAWMLTS